MENDTAYVSKEPSKNDETVEVEVVRLRNPGKDVTFKDEIRGDITFNTKELGDFVIARSVTEPLYHLAVVIDDETMGITHVIRGDDHISNTPRQILIQEAFGFKKPIYAHMPLILAPDRSKLSKRKGETSINVYAKEFFPEALVNYLALLGWNPGTEQEIFSLAELIDAFSLEKIQKGGAIFDIEKIKSINQEYLRKSNSKELRDRVTKIIPQNILENNSYSEKKLNKIIPLLLERARTYKEIEEQIESGEINFYFERPSFDIQQIAWKEEEVSDAKKHLKEVHTLLKQASFETNERIKESLWDYATAAGRGSVLWPLRYSLTGREKSPDPFTVANILGKDETLERLKVVIENE